MTTYQVYYIAGAGRSGSTILDIILGNSKNHFSSGELNNLFSNGYFNNEYCSCNERVKECEFWSKVINDWLKQSSLSMEDYQNVLSKYLRNKATFQLLKQLIFPSPMFSNALRDTKLLYELISKRSGCSNIIDSSKSAQRLLFLRKAGLRVYVILLRRNFFSVLNSNKKKFTKDIKRGIERDLSSLSTRYVFVTWLLDNILPRIFSLGLKKVNVRYEDLVTQPKKTLKFAIERSAHDFEKLITQRGPFNAPHLCAGNRMRLNDEIYLEN